MTLRKFIVLISSLLFLHSSFALSAENRGIKLPVERLALVIGNSAYQTAPLKNPLNDAEDMAATLRNLGFEVVLKKNADQRTMEDAGNQINIVILDACRSDPFSRNFRTSERGLARMDAPKGSLIAYATAPGDVAADGSERNGIFTKYLMKHMIVPNLPIERVLKQARIDVARATNGRQIPWESSSLLGDFYFNPAKASEVMETSELSSPTENQGKTLAATPKSKEKIMRPDYRYKFAIFPWKQDIFYKARRSYFYDVYFDAVKNS
jgi:uncharacterized caspase-like protein